MPLDMLVLDKPIREELRALAARAAADPTPLAIITGLLAGTLQPVEINQGKEMDVPRGYHLVFTHEHQPKGVLRHLSVSMAAPGRVPHPEAVRLLMAEVGFVLSLEECFVWQERCGPNQVAINVVEPLDGDWAPHRKVPPPEVQVSH